MRLRSCLSVLASCVLLPIVAAGQDGGAKGENWCGTPSVAPAGLRADPSDCSYWTTNPTAEYEPDETWAINVVFHVLRSSLGAGNVGNKRLKDQIEVLNQDFNALPGSLGEEGYQAKILFQLATEDPEGNPTNGINRYLNDDWFADQGAYWDSLAWDPTRYINIYCNSAQGFLGYVPFLPQTGSPGSKRDRVVVKSSSVGVTDSTAAYQLGRTATHEVGHYLGLFHTFNNEVGTGCDDQSVPACYSGGDRICDTNGGETPDSGCPAVADSSCGTENPIHNYMNYTDDICMNNFTQEQIRRVRCTIQEYRPGLPQPAPVAAGEPAVRVAAPDALEPAFPNPFNPRTSIRFELARAGAVSLAVFDARGSLVRELLEADGYAAGRHEVSWNGTDARGRAVASGVYFARLSTEDGPLTQRIVLMR